MFGSIAVFSASLHDAGIAVNLGHVFFFVNYFIPIRIFRRGIIIMQVVEKGISHRYKKPFIYYYAYTYKNDL